MDIHFILYGLIFIAAIVTLFAFLINNWKNGRMDEYEYETELDFTDQTWDTSVQMTDIMNEALDLYDRSNIRVPKDIIEDAAIHHFDTVERAVTYIENQRHYWIKENQKKVLK